MSFFNSQDKRAQKQVEKLLKAKNILKKCHDVIQLLDSEPNNGDLVGFRKKAAELIKELNEEIKQGLKISYSEYCTNNKHGKIQTSDRYLLRVLGYLSPIMGIVKHIAEKPITKENTKIYEKNVRRLLRVTRPISRIAMLNLNVDGTTVYKELTNLFKKLKTKNVKNKLLLEDPNPPEANKN